MKKLYISKFVSGALFTGLLFIALMGMTASNSMAQRLTVDKAVCDNIGQQDTCNGPNPSLAGQTLEFTVTNVTTSTAQASIFVTINQGNDAKATSGTTTVNSTVPVGDTVRICEINTPMGFDSVPRPGDSTGGQQSAGGPGFEDCIVATVNNGNNVFKFINDRIELGPTAATAMIAGRVTTDTGFVRGSGRLLVTVLNTRTLETQVVFSNRLGYYEFNDLPIGDTYVISVRGKGYSFTPQIISLIDDSAVDMVGSSVGRSGSKGAKIR